MSIIICKDCSNNFKKLHDVPLGHLVSCPSCGSAAQTTDTQVLSSIKIQWRVTSTNIPNALVTLGNKTSLAVQTVVLAQNKTAEGRLVEAVALPWFEIIEFLTLNPTAIFQISFEKWEEIIAGAYLLAGFDDVTLTPRSGDLGRDVIAVKRGIGSIRVLDQVKAYKPGHLVTADDVRALYGIVDLDHAAKGFITTTSNFAPRIMDDPLLRKVIPSRVELVNGDDLLQRLEALGNKRGNFFPS